MRATLRFAVVVVCLFAAACSSGNNATSTATPHPPSATIAPPSAVAAKVRTGIVNDAPFPGSEYSFVEQNAGGGWNDQGEFVQVWAGNEGEQDPSQGALVEVVTTYDEYGDAVSSSQNMVFPTPTKHGAVTITAVHGSVLTVKADDGTEWAFDVGTNSFENGQGQQ